MPCCDGKYTEGQQRSQQERYAGKEAASPVHLCMSVRFSTQAGSENGFSSACPLAPNPGGVCPPTPYSGGVPVPPKIGGLGGATE